MTVWQHIKHWAYCTISPESIYDAVMARVSGLWHLVRGHKLHWRYRPALWIGCTGDIICDECPDTTDNCGLVIWSRFGMIKAWLASKVCGMIGHPGWQHPQRRNDVEANYEVDDFDDPRFYNDVMDEWTCTRCIAWRKDSKLT